MAIVSKELEEESSEFSQENDLFFALQTLTQYFILLGMNNYIIENDVFRHNWMPFKKKDS